DTFEHGPSKKHPLIAVDQRCQSSPGRGKSIHPAIHDTVGRDVHVKQPAATPDLFKQSSAWRSAPDSSEQSACRNNSTSPRAWAAPAFIWLARPPGARRKRSAPAAASHVASLLPPSTMIISCDFC